MGNVIHLWNVHTLRYQNRMDYMVKSTTKQVDNNQLCLCAHFDSPIDSLPWVDQIQDPEIN